MKRIVAWSTVILLVQLLLKLRRRGSFPILHSLDDAGGPFDDARTVGAAAFEGVAASSSSSGGGGVVVGNGHPVRLLGRALLLPGCRSAN